jgi:hypothetical protein
MSSSLQWAMFTIMLVVENQRFKNQTFFMVPFQPMMNTYY